MLIWPGSPLGVVDGNLLISQHYLRSLHEEEESTRLSVKKVFAAMLARCWGNVILGYSAWQQDLTQYTFPYRCEPDQAVCLFGDTDGKAVGMTFVVLYSRRTPDRRDATLQGYRGSEGKS